MGDGHVTKREFHWALAAVWLYLTLAFMALSDDRRAWSSLMLVIGSIGFCLSHIYIAARVRQPPPDLTGPWVAEARQLLAAGNKIGAIKAVREATGLGLAEAKALVDSWA